LLRQIRKHVLGNNDIRVGDDGAKRLHVPEIIFLNWAVLLLNA
jgi:hypothetical protein